MPHFSEAAMKLKNGPWFALRQMHFLPLHACICAFTLSSRVDGAHAMGLLNHRSSPLMGWLRVGIVSKPRKKFIEKKENKMGLGLET